MTANHFDPAFGGMDFDSLTPKVRAAGYGSEISRRLQLDSCTLADFPADSADYRLADLSFIVSGEHQRVTADLWSANGSEDRARGRDWTAPDDR